MKREILGLFGGTFAPPHNGHVHALDAFRRAVNPDRTLIMPTGIPPHKQKDGDDTPALRLAMCREAFGAFPDTEISDYEMRQEGKSYTIYTLEHLASPEREIVLLCGSDMFLTLSKWYRAPEIFRLASIAALAREPSLEERMRESAERYRQEYGARVILIDAEPVELSSTEVRCRIREGGDLTAVLPSGVARIVQEEKLYGFSRENGQEE